MLVRRASPAECISVGHLPVVCCTMAWVGEDEDGMAGIGGLAWFDGRCWLWFDSVRPGIATAVRTLRTARRALATARQFEEKTVWLARDASLDTSEKLVSMLGFSKTDDELRGMEVWACQV